MVPEYFELSQQKKTRLAKWAGGKGGYASKIVKILPDGHSFFEPYCGMANVYSKLEKPYRVVALNDLNGDVINLFRVLQDREKFDILTHKLVYTPYSIDEFKTAIELLQSEDGTDIDRAYSFFVAQNQGFSGISKSAGNWGRTINPTVQPEYVGWQKRISNLENWHKLMMNVYLDNRDAIEFIKYWDSDKECVFYLDPPYIQDTRVSKNVYKHETTDNHHELLVNALLALKGKAVLSGYDHPIYAPLLDAGWEQIDFNAHANMATKGRGSSVRETGVPKRTETLYVKK